MGSIYIAIKALNDYVFYSPKDPNIPIRQKIGSIACRILSLGIVDLLCAGHREYHSIAGNIYCFLANPAYEIAADLYQVKLDHDKDVTALQEAFSHCDNPQAKETFIQVALWAKEQDLVTKLTNKFSAEDLLKLVANTKPEDLDCQKLIAPLLSPSHRR